ncbi:MAG: transglutaminase domain-containing protein, partial [Candidatus Acidiferrales bacterium]
YSTRRYLKGFADAVIPALGSSEEKIDAILNWMSHGPARLPAGPVTTTTDRDPTDTLNYEALLKVCGSATNAFVNLADSAGLSSRRLLLLGPDLSARHVVAEVLIGDRWIVVDPSFRAILRGPDGALLTRQDLVDPVVFAAATGSLPGYDPSYSYNRTVHLRISRMHWIGAPLRRTLDFFVPGWEDSSTISLLAERESFSALIASICLLLTAILLSTGLRWYGETRLGVRLVGVREQLRRAGRALLDTAT